MGRTELDRDMKKLTIHSPYDDISRPATKWARVEVAVDDIERSQVQAIGNSAQALIIALYAVQPECSVVERYETRAETLHAAAQT